MPFRCFTERRQVERNCIGAARKAKDFSTFCLVFPCRSHAAVRCLTLRPAEESPLREITLEDVTIAAEDPLREEYQLGKVKMRYSGASVPSRMLDFPQVWC